MTLTFTMAGADEHEDGGGADLLRRLAGKGIEFKTINMARSSLEEIFVDLVRNRA